MIDPQAILAIQQLEAQGNLEGAIRGYLDLGRKADAARVALRMNRHKEAARLYAEAGMPYESAGASFQGGDLAAALDQLAFVPVTHPQFRQACAYAIQFALKLDRLDFGIENMLGSFVATVPVDAKEVVVFLQLALLYEKEGFPENAIEALSRVLVFDPGHLHARATKTRLEASRLAATALESVVEDDAKFFGRPEKKPKVAPPPKEPVPLPPAPSRATLFEVKGSAGPPPAPLAAPRATIAGRYRLEAKIGTGGMAEVWRATDLDIGEEIALKIFQPLADAGAEERIKAELKLTRRLAHPNVVRIYDIGTHEGRRYISMELLQGRDLQAVPKPVAPAQAVEWLCQACEGLFVAHDQGIIHRDVKPENLFLTSLGKIKVMDFGIAKDSEVRRTRAGMMAGTPEFMSPEQINDMSQVTPATDLYSLGIVAYELLTGTLPFMHKELMPLLMMHVKETPAPLRTKRPDVPEVLEQVVLRAMAKAPADRFPSARAMAEALRASVAGIPG